jgi:hypothetical protein
MPLIYARGAVATVTRPLSVRQASADRPLEFDCRIPSAHLDLQTEFITCKVGDTTHVGHQNSVV